MRMGSISGSIFLGCRPDRRNLSPKRNEKRLHAQSASRARNGKRSCWRRASHRSLRFQCRTRSMPPRKLFFTLDRLMDADPEPVRRAADQIDEYLKWYNPFDDAARTANGG